jgi:hypothetical protein
MTMNKSTDALAGPLHRVVSNVFIRGRWQDNPPPQDASLMVADPVYGNGDADALAKMASDIGLPAAIFMWPEELCSLTLKPDQVLHWVKPESTKNTAKKYSRFVEVIACYGLEFHGSLHWSNRTGLFTDRLFSNDEHPWKKPESLIERLIRNHWPGHGTVYDPCAGSRTVEAVCKRLWIGSFSVDVC